MPRSIGLIPLFRWLAARSQAQLGLGYVVVTAVATALYLFAGAHGVPWLQGVASVISLIAVSLLFTVVTWYRSEKVVQAAFFLAITTAVSYIIGVGVAALFISGGWGVLLGSFFSLPIWILVSALVFGVLVSVGRHFRRFFAPNTLDGNQATSGNQSTS